MNAYKLIRKLQEVVETLEELEGFAEVQLHHSGYSKGWFKDLMESKNALKYLKPLLEMVYEEDLADANEHYYKLQNNRICIFKTNLGHVRYALYSEKAAACNEHIMNDHYALGNIIDSNCAIDEDGHYIEYKTEERWCGFYDVLCGNSEKVTMILYGISSTYPITIKDYQLLKDFLWEIGADNKFGKIERLVVQSLEDREKFVTITI